MLADGAPSGAGNELLDNDSTASSEDRPYLDPSLKRALANHPYGLELHMAYRITTGAIRDYTPSFDLDSQELAEDAMSIDAAKLQREQITRLRQRDYDLLNHLNNRFIQHYPPSVRVPLYTSLVNLLIMVATPIMKDPTRFSPDLAHPDPSLVYPSCSTWFFQASNIIGSSNYLTHVADLSIKEGTCGFAILEVLQAYTTGFSPYTYASDFMSFMGACLATFTSDSRLVTPDQPPRPGPSITPPQPSAHSASDHVTTWRDVAVALRPPRAPVPSTTTSAASPTTTIIPPKLQHGLYWIGVVGFNNIGIPRSCLMRAASSHEGVYAVLDTVGLSHPRHRTFSYRKLHSTKKSPNSIDSRNEGFLLGFKTLTLANDFLLDKRAILGNLDIFANFYNGTVTLSNIGLTREAAALKVAALLNRSDTATGSASGSSPAITDTHDPGSGSGNTTALTGSTDSDSRSGTIPATTGNTDSGSGSGSGTGTGSGSDTPADTTNETALPSTLPVLVTEMPTFPFTLLLPNDRSKEISSTADAIDTEYFTRKGEFMCPTISPMGPLYFHGENRYSVVRSPAAASEWGSGHLTAPPAPESPNDMDGVTHGPRERPPGETPPRAPRQRQGAGSQ